MMRLLPLSNRSARSFLCIFTQLFTAGVQVGRLIHVSQQHAGTEGPVGLRHHHLTFSSKCSETHTQNFDFDLVLKDDITMSCCRCT